MKYRYILLVAVFPVVVLMVVLSRVLSHTVDSMTEYSAEVKAAATQSVEKITPVPGIDPEKQKGLALKLLAYCYDQSFTAGKNLYEVIPPSNRVAMCECYTQGMLGALVTKEGTINTARKEQAHAPVTVCLQTYMKH